MHTWSCMKVGVFTNDRVKESFLQSLYIGRCLQRQYSQYHILDFQTTIHEHILSISV